jgi:hypothetical protein
MFKVPGALFVEHGLQRYGIDSVFFLTQGYQLLMQEFITFTKANHSVASFFSLADLTLSLGQLRGMVQTGRHSAWLGF